MDSNLNQDAQHFSLAERNRELYSSSPGDFLNSEELHQYLPRVIEMINKGNCPGTNPLPGGIPSYGSSLPSVPQGYSLPFVQGIPLPSAQQPVDMQNKIPAAMSQGNNPGARMPEKEVLMEPCTVSPPLNAFLRKAYSKGSFYFLNNKTNDLGK